MSFHSHRYRRLLTSYLRPQASQVLLLLFLVLATIGLQLLNPQILRYFLDMATSGGETRWLVGPALLFIAVALATQLLTVGVTYVGENIAWRATNALRADLTQHCLQLDMSYHNAHNPGEMIERIDGDVTVLANFFSQFGVRVFSSGLLLVGVLALLFREDWRVGVAFTIFALVALAVLNRVRGLAVPHWGASRQSSAELFGFLEERLSGTEDVRSNGGTAYVMRQLYELMRNRLVKDRRAFVIGGVTWTSTVVFFAVGTALSLGLGAYLFAVGTMTIGTVYLIYTYVQLLRTPVEQITQQIQDLQRASASITRIEEMLQTESKVVDGPGVNFPAGALSVSFDDVTFAYKEGSPVLKGLSFELAPGQTLGLLGRTGSGKTTIVRLLYRFYDAAAGEIRLGGQGIRGARLTDLRERIAMVTQDVQIFHGTVRDNLTFFDPHISDAQILQAFRELELWDWFGSLPKGLETELGPGGGGLSAGEAQLLALTRVCLKDPGLIIFDEASSRLDPATEQRVSRAFQRLLRNRTGIIIAHRLASVQTVDQIMIIQDGTILERGGREQLAADLACRFYQLLQTGMGDLLA